MRGLYKSRLWQLLPDSSPHCVEAVLLCCQPAETRMVELFIAAALLLPRWVSPEVNQRAGRLSSFHSCRRQRHACIENAQLGMLKCGAA